MKKVLVSLIIATLIFATLGITINLAAPGDEDDPVVTKSYLDTVFLGKIRDTLAGASESFAVTDVPEGKQVICQAGTELILRKGSGVIVATEKGGLANVTASVDLQSGEAVPANSLLIVPVADGRGFVATSDVIVMIKGKYEIRDYQ